MLTRELLRLTRRDHHVHLSFESPEGAGLNLCAAFLDCYAHAVRTRQTRAELAEALEPLLKGGPTPALAAGLQKILDDHCEFKITGAPENCAELRQEIFRRAAGILAAPPADFEQYRKMVLQGEAEFDFYGDLPDYETLTGMPDWTAVEFLNRYNVALVQGCLLYASSLEVTLEAATPMELRKFIRRLKFFRLLAEVEKCSGRKIKLRLSGPFALFSENRKYGLQLAAFFPVILLAGRWSIRAELRLRDGECEILSLNHEKCPLRSHYQRWSSYVPEEVALFLKAFQREVTQWRSVPDAPLPDMPGEGSIFPDFSFAAADDPKKIIHIELFHRWHSGPLEARLAWLACHPEVPLLLGIDRSLLGKEGEAGFTARHPMLERHGFFFSNYPGVDRVRRMLDKF